MDLLLRRVTLLDPTSGVARTGCDLRVRDGVVEAVGPELPTDAETVVLERPGTVVSPAFLDLHCHLREPGEPHKERIASATAAAAAGGFGAICAMANLRPPVDTVERLQRTRRQNDAEGRIPVLQFAACTAGLEGRRVVEVESLAAAGAVGFSDDGRHAVPQETLGKIVRRAHLVGRLVAIHPENEGVLGRANPGAGSDPPAFLSRPPAAEEAAVGEAIDALRQAACGHLHLQHLSSARAVAMVRCAKAEGLPITAEVTPHHLTLTKDWQGGQNPDAGELRCNPPLRSEEDRAALWDGLLEGTIDAIASDHAPHEPPSPGAEWRPSGFSGVQSALSAVLSDPRSRGSLLRIVAALTTGPHLVLGAQSPWVSPPSVRSGEPAHLTWFDPAGSWTPNAQTWLSANANTPFWERELPAPVLLTFSRGRLAFLSPALRLESEHA